MNHYNSKRPQNNYRAKSSAPYNFIELNKIAISTEELIQLNLIDEERFSGSIEIEVTNLTPLFIRNTLQNINCNQRNDSNFFSPNNSIRIPGSSFRGLTRTMMEIITFGNFGFFEDRYLYFRNFVRSPLKEEYQEYGLYVKDGGYKVKLGFMQKIGRRYEIEDYGHPQRITTAALETDVTNDGKIFYADRWEFYIVGNRLYVHSIGINSNKNDWVIDINNNENHKKIILTDEDVLNYKNDTMREQGPNNRPTNKVPDLLDRAKNGVAVFFIEKSGKTYFGHTGFFRVPYEKSIGDHIPNKIKNGEDPDITTGLFGVSSDSASSDICATSTRVFFEDLIMVPNANAIMNETDMKPLLSPKPTSFQHYLENDVTVSEKNLKHYNSANVNIRGNKLYWHRSESFEESNPNPNISSKVKPIKKDNTFKGKVRFENLSSVELGALLFIFNLPEGLALKLGTGKPFELGSIKIKSQLNLLNLDRYKNIELGWFDDAFCSKDHIGFIKDFESYIINQLGLKVKSIWEIDRMKQLYKMLDFDNKPLDKKTRYLELNEFKMRFVLPKPTQID